MVRKALNLTQREFADRILVATGFIALMETGNRNVNPRIMKLVSNTFNVDLEWLETGKGTMFSSETDQEVNEIINLYKQLNPFFRKFIIKQLRELSKFKNENSEEI